MRVPSYIDCRVNDLAKNEDECALAGATLGFPFLKKVSSIERPSGCYWYDNGYLKNSFFNTNYSEKSYSLSEDTDEWGDRIYGVIAFGGLCKEIGWNIFHKIVAYYRK